MSGSADLAADPPFPAAAGVAGDLAVDPANDPEPVQDVLRWCTHLQELSATTGLEPGRLTDEAFRGLVAACAYRPGRDASAVLANQRVSALATPLRRLCADGEFRLERHWARRIAAAGSPARAAAVLAGFPYLDNYRRLVQLEVHTLTGLGLPRSRLRRAAVLGCGPLPLTALLLARELAVTVDAVDVDPQAAALAATVATALGDRPDHQLDDQPDDQPGEQIRVHCADASRFDCGGADTVLLAALVGLDRDVKRQVIGAVAARMRPGALLLARSAHGLRTLLYPALDPDDLAAAGLQPLAEVHPLDDLVNSILVAAKP